MIDTIAKRAFNLNGTDYAQGDKVPMPAQQFDDLEPAGLVERAPAEKKAPAKKTASTAKTRSKVAPVASAPAAAEAPTPLSSEQAD